MPSINTSEALQSNDNTTCSNLLRLVKMRPVATAAKKFVSKLKSVRIFRSSSSTYVPFRAWEAQYLSDNPQCEAGTRKVESEADMEESEEDILAKVLRVSEDARIEEENQIFRSDHTRAKPVVNASVSDVDHKYNEHSVKEDNGTGEPDIQLLSDMETVKEMKQAAQELKNETSFASLPGTENSCDSVENANIETKKQRVSSSRVSLEEDVATKMSANGTYGCFSRPPSDSEQAPHSETSQSQLSSETVDTVVSDNMDLGIVHEREDNNDETTLSPANDPQPSNPELVQVQIESNDSDVSNIRAEESLMDLGVQNDSSAVVTSTAGGTCCERNCETAENSVDYGQRSQNVESCKKRVLHPAPSEDLSKPEIKNFDPEKAVRIECLRKRVALKNEARLRRAKEYAEKEAVKNRDAGLEGSEIMSPSNSSPIVAGGVQVTPASQTELKTASETFRSTENSSESARWSRKYAEEARERRKRNQKERLLNLMEHCVTTN